MPPRGCERANVVSGKWKVIIIDFLTFGVLKEECQLLINYEWESLVTSLSFFTVLIHVHTDNAKLFTITHWRLVLRTHFGFLFFILLLQVSDKTYYIFSIFVSEYKHGVNILFNYFKNLLHPARFGKQTLI